MEIPDLPELEACTLPTAERPLRLAEFDDLFGTALRRQVRPGPTRLEWTFAAGVEDVARDLTRRESECCSFFAFDVSGDSAAVHVTVQVPEEQVAVLDALERLAGERIPA